MYHKINRDHNNKEKHFIMINGSIYKEYLMILNAYASSNKVPKHMKRNWENYKEKENHSWQF